MMTASGSNVRKRAFQQSPKRECFFQASLVCPSVVDLLIHCIYIRSTYVELGFQIDGVHTRRSHHEKIPSEYSREHSLLGNKRCPVYAFHCPADVKAIDNALPKAKLSAQEKAEVKKLRDKGEALHNAGTHKESVDKLAEAMRIILNHM